LALLIGAGDCGAVFGTKRLGNVGKDLGEAVKGFQEGHAGRRQEAVRAAA
jgi:Sec-independent protein translocase protein TatA